MIVESTTLPNNYKAFTLAEVLITLSILGVVAAITVPQIVRYQSERAAITKMRKAISTYERLANEYIAQTGDSDIKDLVANGCSSLQGYTKMTNAVTKTGSGVADNEKGCLYTAPDGALWFVNSYGNAVVHDSVDNPKYGLVMWTKGGQVNSELTSGMYGSAVPDWSAELPAEVPSYTGGNADIGDVYVE